MNKQELAAYVAEQAGLSNAAAQKAIDAFCKGVTVSMQQGNEVKLVGFGTFAPAQRSAREGRNPQTGETMKIAASVQAKFKPGKALKDALNN